MTGNNDYHSGSPPLVSKGGKNPPPIVLYLLSEGITASDSFSTTLSLCFSFRGSWEVSQLPTGLPSQTGIKLQKRKEKRASYPFR